MSRALSRTGTSTAESRVAERRKVLLQLPEREALELAQICGESFLKTVPGGWKPISRGSILVFSRDLWGEPTDVGMMEKTQIGRQKFTLLERRTLDQEGYLMAQWLAKNGIAAFVLEYRLPNGHKEVPLEDAQAALRYTRKNAKKWGVDPAQVGICGSSAGGHLAAYTSTFTEDKYKPAFSVLFYPVITGTTWATHQNTFQYLLGKNRTYNEQHYYSLENRVTTTTPPTILLLSDDDLTVPPISSILYYEALKANGVPATMHIYPSGGHGWCGHDEFKYSEQYKDALSDWLKIQSKNAKK